MNKDKKSAANIRVDSEENWNKAINYIPDQFTIIVYQYENDAPRIKLGDGVHSVQELPFLIRSQQVNGDTLKL